jgi:glycerol kinase
MSRRVLALDQGTTSSRALLFDERVHIAARAQHEFPQFYPQPGYVEHDPMDILYSQYRAAADCLRGAGDAKVEGIGITNQRETVIVWDRATGKPVHNAIVWQCRRTAAICEALTQAGHGPLFTERTGLLLDPYFSGTKLKWLLDHVPGARERGRRGELLFGTVDSWLIWNLTGGRAHVTDVTNASRTLLMNADTLGWDAELCGLLDIPMEMLPKIVSCSEVYGTVAEGLPGLSRLAGVPVCGAAGDQQAALFGQSCFRPGDAKCTYGTGCFLLVNTGKTRVRSKNKLLSTVAWSLGGAVEYAIEGSVFNAGSVIKWLRDELGLIQTARECDVLAESVPDSGGVYFVPAFTGLGAPYWDSYARGAIYGLTRGTNRAHLARATLESICFQVQDFIGAVREDTGMPIASFKADGGAAVSDVMLQFQADLLGAEVLRPANVETTALGAAGLAGLAAGVWRSRDEFAAHWKPERAFRPSTDESQREAMYKNWRNAINRTVLKGM